MSSVVVNYVENSPNPRNATFFVEGDYLGDYEKVCIPRNISAGSGKQPIPNPKQELSPLAKFMFQHTPPVLSRLDFYTQQGKTYISGVTANIGRINEKAVDTLGSLLTTFFNEQNSPVLNANDIKQKGALTKAFHTGGDPLKSMIVDIMDKAINPILWEDGGSMEILDIGVNNGTGLITCNIALLGSCSGCSSSETQTLAKGKEKITRALDSIKATYPNDPVIQRWHFNEFTKMPAQDGLFITKQSYRGLTV